jgi:thiamine biosynthesis protein ThiS
MNILLNGDRRDLASGTTVKSLLEGLGLDARVVAVELNRKVVKRDHYQATVIPPDAEVEIVSFVGGG